MNTGDFSQQQSMIQVNLFESLSLFFFTYENFPFPGTFFIESTTIIDNNNNKCDQSNADNDGQSANNELV